MAYVDAEKLKKNVRVNLMPNVDVDGTVTVENAERYFLNLIDKTSTADVVEVKHGAWEQNPYCKRIYFCSECGRHIEDGSFNPYEYFLYCHCGAKMDGTPKERGGG